MTHSVSAFFTSYSALLDGKRTEAVAVVISDQDDGETILQMVVVDQEGKASLVRADQLDMYGAYETEEDREPK